MCSRSLKKSKFVFISLISTKLYNERVLHILPWLIHVVALFVQISSFDITFAFDHYLLQCFLQIPYHYTYFVGALQNAGAL